MAHGSVRFRRWFDALGKVLPGDVDVPEDEPPVEAPSIRKRAASITREHPVATAWVLAALVGAVSFRHFLGPAPLTGGVLPAFPSSPIGFFQELFSGVRTTPIGGAQAASPALAALGGLSVVTFASTRIAEKILLVALPFLGAVGMYRLLLRSTGNRIAGLLGAWCYGLSALFVWTFSVGRIPALVGLAVLPRIADRLGVAFGEGTTEGRTRFIVGGAVFLAVGFAFDPGIALALAILVAVFFLVPEERRRRFSGIGLTLGVVVSAALLVFPLLVDLAGGKGYGLNSSIGEPNFPALVRLVLGPGEGAWRVSWFLPAAAVLGVAIAGRDRRRDSLRYMLAALAGLGLAWAAAAGYLPAQFSNPTAYLSVAALGYCGLVALGMAAVFGGLEGRSFGVRQILAVVAAAIVFGGLALQSGLAMTGSWEIGRDRLPPAWPIVGDQPGAFRVLWIGVPNGSAFPSPGGDPARLFAAGSKSLDYSVTSPQGVSALDTGRPAQGDGYSYIDRVLAELFSGTNHHCGALLAQSGINYIVASPDAMTPAIAEKLDAQFDLDRVPAQGLVIYKNEHAQPLAALYAQPEYAAAVASGSLAAVSALPLAAPQALVPVTGGWNGAKTEKGTILVSDQFASGWRLHQEGTELPPDKAFGWEVSFASPSGTGPFTIRYADQWIRDAEIAILTAFWLVAMWVTRKPVRR
jgi:hypothetical protein